MKTRNQRKRIRYEVWSNLLSSDWFVPMLFRYLKIYDKANLDSAICNHRDRKNWLDNLRNLEIILRLDDKVKIFYKNLLNWIVLKKLQLVELALYLTTPSSNALISKVTRNNPNLRKLTISGDFLILGNRFVSNIVRNCHKLQDLHLIGNVLPVILSLFGKHCNQLKSVEIDLEPFFNMELFDSNELCGLFKNNHHLKDLLLKSRELSGEVLATLGNHCPALENCYLDRIVDRANMIITTAQIEKFTKGCSHLKYLRLDYGIDKCNELLMSLGIHNHLLRTLDISSTYDVSVNEIITVDPECFECLLKGCPKLRTIFLSNLNLCALNFTNLAQYDMQLEGLHFTECEVTEIFFSEIGKLPLLKELGLYGCKNITDQGIINFVTNAHKLVTLGIGSCAQLTDLCLFSIAANCPEIESIILNTERGSFTVNGNNELKKKCPKFKELTIQ